MATNVKKEKKKKVVIKKRFFVICVLIVVIVLFLMIMGLKSVVGLIFGNDRGADTTGGTGTKVEADVNNGQSSSNDIVDSQVNTQNQQTSQNQQNTQTNTNGNVNNTNVIAFTGIPATDSTEYEINNAVLSSWYISPLGQRRSTVDETFGTISRSEEWGRRIFYHRSFVDTMYVTYKGELKGDNTPVKDAVCDSVSIALKNIMEFDKFTPNVSFWGEMHEDEGPYSEGPYYLISIRDDITMKVFCDQQGRVSGESHIIVSKC